MSRVLVAGLALLGLMPAVDGLHRTGLVPTDGRLVLALVSLVVAAGLVARCVEDAHGRHRAAAESDAGSALLAVPVLLVAIMLVALLPARRRPLPQQRRGEHDTLHTEARGAA